MKLFKKIIIFVLIFAGIIFIFNIPVTTKQGINGVVSIRKIPIYAKLCGFLYRDYQYTRLSREIIKGIEGDTEKIMAIYNWAVKNIKKPSKDFPGVDDHIWDIIVRHYGAADQMADVFTTLVSYAGYEAFWKKFYIDGEPEYLLVSFVKIGDEWYIFDVYNREYFISKKEGMGLSTPYGPTYGEYLEGVDETIFETRIRRADMQKIFPRIIYEFKKIFNPVKNDRK